MDWNGFDCCLHHCHSHSLGQYDYGYFLHCGCGLHGYEQVLLSSGLGEASTEFLNYIFLVHTSSYGSQSAVAPFNYKSLIYQLLVVVECFHHQLHAHLIIQPFHKLLLLCGIYGHIIWGVVY